MHIYESSRRNHPKDLTLLGKCDGIHYPLNNNSKGGHFCWSRRYKGDIIWLRKSVEIRQRGLTLKL